ncbi:MAG TPA: metal-dependent hydrolase [Myxococcales bacterium]|nr:metal-dependent hydrolase [Myxococcales bacterium]
MASLIGHGALGLLAARFGVPAARGRARALAAAGMVALSMLPDADVVGFKLGIPYPDPFGHRGATHSFLFAAVAGALAALAVRSPRLAPWCMALIATHPLLDALTDGGLGVALFWPLSDRRFFFPWRPIPVSPIGPGFLSARGLRVALTELVLFAPAYALALWPSRAPRTPPPSPPAAW